MKQRRLGRSHLHVSELCLNTATFGRATDEAASLALLDAYHQAGGRFVQSRGNGAPSSPAHSVDSASEEIVGRWREARGINRDALVLATRISVSRPAYGGSIAFANLIRDATERSLRRLRTKHIDLLLCDWDERLAPVEDLLEEVDRLIRAGLVRCAVADGFPPWRVVDSIHRSNTRAHARFEALQAEYSLMSRAHVEPETFSLCREYRLGFLARAPLAGGFLARSPISVRELLNLDRDWRSEGFGHHRGEAVLQALARIADQRTLTPAQIALAWVLRNPCVTSAVISPTDPRELRELIHAADLLLTEDETAALAHASRMQDCWAEPRTLHLLR